MYVYRHIRLDKNIPFYIGVGSDSNGKYYRANAKGKNARSTHWHRVVALTAYQVEIIADNLSEKEALEKEKEFIALYKRVNDGGTLVNHTLGGEGILGHKHSGEARAKISRALAVRETTLETRLKRSRHMSARTISSETRDKMSKSHTGMTRSFESLVKHAMATKKYDCLINLEDGIFYDTAVEAARAYNINMRNLSRRQKGLGPLRKLGYEEAERQVLETLS